MGSQFEGRSPLAWERRACNCRVHNRPNRRRDAAGRRARRNSLHACVDCLSRGSVDACEERRDQAERRKFELFHKWLRLLNITKVSLLQALTETRFKVIQGTRLKILLAKNQSRICMLDCAP